MIEAIKILQELLRIVEEEGLNLQELCELTALIENKVLPNIEKKANELRRFNNIHRNFIADVENDNYDLDKYISEIKNLDDYYKTDTDF